MILSSEKLDRILQWSLKQNIILFNDVVYPSKMRQLILDGRLNLEKSTWILSENQRKISNSTNKNFTEPNSTVESSATPIRAKRRKDKCMLCANTVSKCSKSLLSHTLGHVKKEYGIKSNFYTCSLCPKENRYSYSNDKNQRKHLRKKHDIKKDFKKYYIDNRFEHEDLVKKMMIRCFGKSYGPHRDYRSNKACSEKLKKMKTCIKCTKCESVLENNYGLKRLHCYQHLKKNGIFSYLYECLLCETSHFRGNNCYQIKKHLRSPPHNICSPQVNIHYMDRSKQYELQIQLMMDECFGHNATFKRTERNWKANVSKIKCSKCSMLVINTLSDKSDHCYNHFVGNDESKWHFQCLLCSDYSCLDMEGLTKHVNENHNINSRLEDGLHYFDRRKALKEVIEKEVKLCFEQSNIPTAEETMDQYSKCLKCGAVVPKLLHSMNLHIVLHLKEGRKIDKLFECLLCEHGVKFGCLSVQDMHRHIVKVHKFKQGRIGVHYSSLMENFQQMIDDERLVSFEQHS